MLAAEIVAEIASDGGPVTVDLRTQRVALDSKQSWSFDIGVEAKAMLLEGLDAVDLTLKHKAQIAAFFSADHQARPWIYLGDRQR